MWRDQLVAAWYQKKLTRLTLALKPLSWLFGLVVWLRRLLYQGGFLSVYALRVPVIVVGNISVGGTGKTPTVVALALYLKSQGFKVGIISRGVGGLSGRTPLRVYPYTEASLAGDEAVLIAQQTGCPMVVCRSRVLAAHYLLKNEDCDVVISDDGLQHYRLKADIKIALVDQARRYGNECLLPAGPLREPVSRLAAFDFALTTGKSGDIILKPLHWCSLRQPMQTLALTAFAGQKANVLAGISNPQAFFETVSSLGVQGHYHPFKDHYAYRAQDLVFVPPLPVLMTHKDAVKCAAFILPDAWYLSQTAILPESFQQAVIQKLKEVSAREFKN